MHSIFSILHDLKQPHLAEGVDQLSPQELEQFAQQLNTFPASLLKEQRDTLKCTKVELSKPIDAFDLPNEITRKEGEAALSRGKVASLILSGGQGARLASPYPKALIPMPLIQKKTLLQIFCEKNLAASKAFSTPLQMAVMTSSINHDIIRLYLEKNGYFGLSPQQLHLFNQENVPLLNEDRNWFLDGFGKLAAAPDGNGHALHNLMNSGIGNQWLQHGIESVIVLPIDNPLADPFDPNLCGYHICKNREVTIKVIRRNNPLEKVGVVVDKNGKIGVQEYLELPDYFEAPLAHIGLFCFSLSFIANIKKISIPWHAVKKREGKQLAWKFEKFIFDLLPYSEYTGILLYPREEVYSPLKNSAGDKSMETVQAALLGLKKSYIPK